ncbi:MAG: hypothetical protein M1815_005537 [Lichina confinis]|nr:MAG: hypothetical protein M1815_005537 [Lichina confinis]
MGPPKPESSDQVPEAKGKPPKGPDNESSFGIWNIIDMVRGNMAYSFSRSTAVGPPRRYRIPTPSRGFR